MKYRKKPVVIEAKQVMSYHDLEPITDWIIDSGGHASFGQEDSGPAFTYISTLEGVMQANIFDYVIRGVKNEFYSCKPDIFEMTYEKVEE